MDSSNFIPVISANNKLHHLAATDSKQQSNSLSPDGVDSFFEMYNRNWLMMMMMAIKLSNTIQSRSQERNEEVWRLYMDWLKEKRNSIEDSYKASRDSAFGLIGGGIIGLSSVLAFGQEGLAISGMAAPMVSGLANVAAAEENRKAEGERAMADLQLLGAQSYSKDFDEIIAKAREIMQRILDMGRGLNESISQTLSALSNRR